MSPHIPRISFSPVFFLLLAPHSPAAALGSDVKVEYYDVRGADINSVTASMMSGREFAGRTYWNLSYEYNARSQPGGCKADSVMTKLELRMSLPRWTPPAGVSGDMVDRWQRFIAALQLHEEGHLENAKNLERSARGALLAVSAPDCGALNAALRARFDQVLERGRAEDRDYDQRTGHGKTQGATLR